MCFVNNSRVHKEGLVRVVQNPDMALLVCSVPVVGIVVECVVFVVDLEGGYSVLLEEWLLGQKVG